MRIKDNISFSPSPHPNDLHPLPPDFPSVYIMSGRFNIYASPPPTPVEVTSVRQGRETKNKKRLGNIYIYIKKCSISLLRSGWHARGKKGFQRLLIPLPLFVPNYSVRRSGSDFGQNGSFWYSGDVCSVLFAPSPSPRYKYLQNLFLRSRCSAACRCNARGAAVLTWNKPRVRSMLEVANEIVNICTLLVRLML